MGINLLDQTYKMLAESDQTHREIADGAGVNYWWFIKFYQRAIPNPTVGNVQRVYDYLLNRKAAA